MPRYVKDFDWRCREGCCGDKLGFPESLIARRILRCETSSDEWYVMVICVNDENSCRRWRPVHSQKDKAAVLNGSRAETRVRRHNQDSSVYGQQDQHASCDTA